MLRQAALALPVGLSRQAVYRIKDDPAGAEPRVGGMVRGPHVPGNVSPAAAAVDANRRQSIMTPARFGSSSAIDVLGDCADPRA